MKLLVISALLLFTSNAFAATEYEGGKRCLNVVAPLTNAQLVERFDMLASTLNIGVVELKSGFRQHFHELPDRVKTQIMNGLALKLKSDKSIPLSPNLDKILADRRSTSSPPPSNEDLPSASSTEATPALEATKLYNDQGDTVLLETYFDLNTKHLHIKNAVIGIDVQYAFDEETNRTILIIDSMDQTAEEYLDNWTLDRTVQEIVDDLYKNGILIKDLMIESLNHLYDIYEDKPNVLERVFVFAIDRTDQPLVKHLIKTNYPGEIHKLEFLVDAFSPMETSVEAFTAKLHLAGYKATAIEVTSDKYISPRIEVVTEVKAPPSHLD